MLQCATYVMAECHADSILDFLVKGLLNLYNPRKMASDAKASLFRNESSDTSLLADLEQKLQALRTELSVQQNRQAAANATYQVESPATSHKIASQL